MSTVTIPLTVSRRTLDRLHALRLAAGLTPVPDSVLITIVWGEGVQAEMETLERLAEAEAAQ